MDQFIEDEGKIGLETTTADGLVAQVYQ
jgi:hypothetical protein